MMMKQLELNLSDLSTKSKGASTPAAIFFYGLTVVFPLHIFIILT
jgi:hypothetical protein